MPNSLKDPRSNRPRKLGQSAREGHVFGLGQRWFCPANKFDYLIKRFAVEVKRIEQDRGVVPLVSDPLEHGDVVVARKPQPRRRGCTSEPAAPGAARTFSILLQRANLVPDAGSVTNYPCRNWLRIMGKEALVSLLSGIAGYVFGGISKPQQPSDEPPYSNSK
jgi:hypothetical protein